MKKLVAFFATAMLLATPLLVSNTTHAQQLLDRVVVVVDDGVVLQSQIDQLVQQVKAGNNFNLSLIHI